MPPVKRSPHLTDEQRIAIRTQQKADAPRAMADYQAAQQATRDRTAALRLARLARLARKTTRPRNKQHEPDEQDE